MPIFSQEIGEKEVTRAIIQGFAKDFENIIESDVVVVGAGPSGLMAARELGRAGAKVVLLERNNFLGGGYWIGGYLMNKVTARAPAQKVWEELGIRFEEAQPGLYVTTGPEACSKTIAAACDAGVTVLNMTVLEDLVMREGRVAGAVINWTPIQRLPKEITCLDPVAIESKAVIDATGHDAEAASVLEEKGELKLPGHGSMWIGKSEDALVEHTGSLYPGLYVCGMAVTTAFGLNRMGPTFGAMLLSGQRVAEAVLEDFRKQGVQLTGRQGGARGSPASVKLPEAPGPRRAARSPAKRGR